MAATNWDRLEAESEDTGRKVRALLHEAVRLAEGMKDATEDDAPAHIRRRWEIVNEKLEGLDRLKVLDNLAGEGAAPFELSFECGVDPTV